MYKRICLLILLLFFIKISNGYSQSKEVKFLIDTSIVILKENSVNSAKINWNKLRNKALLKATNINNPYNLGEIMRSLYKSVNDFHGAFFYRDSVFKWNSNQPIVDDSIAKEFKKGVKSMQMILPNSIGYLRVPSMGGGDYDLKAQRLNDSLCVLLNRNVKGIILDLRLNGGGAMHPMILGLKQLLGDGNIGFFKTNIKENWNIRDDSFLIDTTIFAKIIPKCNLNARNIPVVILVSLITGSSAECLIIAFKGRENTVLLGSNTAGYLTINKGFPIDEFSFMNVSVGYSGDRNGKIYIKPIKPDLPFVSVYKFNDISNDENVIEAIKWLKLRIN